MKKAVDALDVFESQLDLSELTMLAKTAMRERRWTDAIDCWRSVLQVGNAEEAWEARLQLARAYRQTGRLQEAEAELESLIESDPGSVDVRCVAEYARVAMNRRDWAEALARWFAVLEAYGGEMPPGGYAQMARCQVWLNDHYGAERLVQRAVKSYPKHPAILTEWCAVAVARGDLREARRRAAVASDRLNVVPEALRSLSDQIRLAVEWRELISTSDDSAGFTATGRSHPQLPPIVLVTHRPIDYYQSPCGSVYQLFVHPTHRVAEPLAHINVSLKRDAPLKLAQLADRPFHLLCNGLASLTTPDSVQLLEEAWVRGIPVIVYWHETAWSIRGALARFHSVMRRVVPLLKAVQATHFVVTSQGVHSLVALFGIPFERIRVVHEVVDLARFRPRPLPQEHGRVPVVLGAGSESRAVRKGADTFSVIAHLVRRTMDVRPEFRWYLSSDPARPTPPVPYAEAVDWRGHSTRFEDALGEADCFILTSRDDPAARVVLEALASGVPVLTFASTGFVELLPESMVCSSYEDMVRKLARILQGERESPQFYRSIAERFSSQDWLLRAFGSKPAAVAPVPDADLGVLSRSYLVKQERKLRALKCGPDGKVQSRPSPVRPKPAVGALDTSEFIEAVDEIEFPRDLAIAVEQAKLATDEQNWPEAVERWSGLLERDDWTAPPAAFLSLSTAYRKQNALSEFDETVTRGWRCHPESLELAIAWVQAAILSRNWHDAVARCETVLDAFGEEAGGRVHRLLSQASRRLMDLDGAEEAAAVDSSSPKEKKRLLIEHAAALICRRNWTGAERLFEQAYGEDLGAATGRFLLDAASSYAETCGDTGRIVDLSFVLQHMLAYAARVLRCSRELGDAMGQEPRHDFIDAVVAVKRSETVFVLGSGQSILHMQPEHWEAVRAHNSIGFNNWLVHEFVPDIFTFEVKHGGGVTQRMLHNLQAVKHDYRDVPILWKDCWSFDGAVLGAHASHLSSLDIYFPLCVELEACSVSEFAQNLLLSRSLRRLAGCAAFILQKRASLVALVDIAVEMGFKNIVLCGVDLNGSSYFWEGGSFRNTRGLVLPERASTSAAHRTNDPAFGELTIDLLLGAYRDTVLTPAGVELYVASSLSALYPNIPEYKWS